MGQEERRNQSNGKTPEVQKWEILVLLSLPNTTKRSVSKAYTSIHLKTLLWCFRGSLTGLDFWTWLYVHFVRLIRCSVVCVCVCLWDTLDNILGLIVTRVWKVMAFLTMGAADLYHAKGSISVNWRTNDSSKLCQETNYILAYLREISSVALLTWLRQLQFPRLSPIVKDECIPMKHKKVVARKTADSR